MPVRSTLDRKLPKVKCEYCGSTWFREVPLEQFATMESEEPRSLMRLGVWVCLCGMAVWPNVGGVRGGRTAQREIHEFMNNFQRTTAQMPARGAAERLLAEIQSGLMTTSQKWQVLDELQAAERQIGRWLHWADGKGSKPGRHWGMPKRPAATNGRDQMVVALQQRGFTFRKSRWLVRTFWDLMADLLGSGEVIDTPIGTFAAVASPKRQVRRRFGRRQVLFARRKRIRFWPA